MPYKKGDIETALPLVLDGSPLDLDTAFDTALEAVGLTAKPDKKYVLFVTGASSELDYADTVSGKNTLRNVDAGEKILVVTDSTGNPSTATVLADDNAERIATLEKQVTENASLLAADAQNLQDQLNLLKQSVAALDATVNA